MLGAVVRMVEREIGGGSFNTPDFRGFSKTNLLGQNAKTKSDWKSTLLSERVSADREPNCEFYNHRDKIKQPLEAKFLKSLHTKQFSTIDRVNLLQRSDPNDETLNT